MNLVVNARDAMPQGGMLTIETANAVLDASYASLHHGVTPGSYVMLAVSDTGEGMDAATQARIFEPFFTTKEPGKGTGLGLSMVHGVVRQHGGAIQVRSVMGGGTTFEIYLPQVTSPVEPARIAETTAGRETAGRETILLAEDEDDVRALTREVLERQGSRVLEASDLVQALPRY